MAQWRDKPVVWLKGEVKTPPFSEQARLEAGFLLRRLQQGEVLGLPHSRPMPSIGGQCHELRINDREQTQADCLPPLDRCDRNPRGIQQEGADHSVSSIGDLRQAAGWLLESDGEQGVTMNSVKKNRLERAGWVVGDTAQFLQPLLVGRRNTHGERQILLCSRRKIARELGLLTYRLSI